MQRGKSGKKNTENAGSTASEPTNGLSRTAVIQFQKAYFIFMQVPQLSIQSQWAPTCLG